APDSARPDLSTTTGFFMRAAAAISMKRSPSVFVSCALRGKAKRAREKTDLSKQKGRFPLRENAL
ncbi:MAG: hypothetical protein PHP23_15690, partial [Desulfobacterales bacterium]|nr:hypothetical protein [Desulfobacterales bacterium]